MEEIKKLLEEDEECSGIWSDGCDSQVESPGHNFENFADGFLNFESNTDLNLNTLTSKKRSGKERLPTRRPDPNVYNRNALLARENRKKKKRYLETIEKELYIARKANRVLIKALRRQMKIGHRLEQEKEFFKGLIETEDTKTFSESSSLHSLKLLSPEERYNLANCSGNKLGCGTGSIDADSVPNGTVNNTQNSSFDFHIFPDFCTDFENNSMRQDNAQLFGSSLMLRIVLKIVQKLTQNVASSSQAVELSSASPPCG